MTYIRRSPAAPGEPRSRKERATRAAASAAALLLVAGGGLTAWSLSSQTADAAAEQPSSAAKKANKGDDFNNDGYADMVVGAPGGTVSGKASAGYVTVTYGSADGLDPSHKTVVDRTTSGVPGSAAAKQQFGASFSKGDLDGDGFDDLVIGSETAKAGSVILWGSSEGLTGGTAVPSYGATPQAGDFDGDGKTDLVLLGDPGSSGDDPVAQPAALWKGPVSREGKPAKKTDFLDKSQWNGYDEQHPGAKCAENDSCIDGPDSFSGPSETRAVGDVNGDDRQDMAVWRYEGDGVYGNDVLLGGDSGFKVAKGPEGDRVDMDLGDVDGDGFDDLVASASSDLEDEINVAFGTKDGLSKSRKQTFDQTIDGFPGEKPQDGELFGSCVSVADVTGDGKAEVALGIRWKDGGDKTDSGAVGLLPGSKSGVTGAGSQLVDQDSEGVPGVAEEGDELGASCALLDVDGDGHRDLNVSSTEENETAGALWSLRGTEKGVTTDGAKAFGPLDVEAPDKKALFGSTLR
ncbi:hypothetical protein HCC61_23555 [Streptomyces sp. HNM0575]|uniref:FG-GAP repeat protein n=1 Tax=Streptomyces sp. HNM0575 TaxID=2716338 RepID=UPI00145FA245|nr:FG-GAP repeat protein [Streptomyces sp. HNM0575]NLU75599.1 hypothetical protein [Streptomyces sp. HNM0575]